MSALIVPVEKHYNAQVYRKFSSTHLNFIWEKLSENGLLDHLEGSKFNNLFEVEKQLCFQGCVIHKMLLHRIQSSELDELRFRINGNGFCFGPKEFGLITGLNFGKFPTPDEREKYMKNNGLIKRYFPHYPHVTVDMLHRAFQKCLVADDIWKLGLCLIVEQVLLTSTKTSTVWPDLLHMVEDQNAFDNYPWGVVAYKKLFLGIVGRKLSSKKRTYHVPGFNVALQMWAYETFKEISTKFADQVNAELFPRMLKWIPKSYVTHIQWTNCIDSVSLFPTPMRPIGTVEEGYLNSFQCSRPLVEQHELDTIQALEETDFDQLPSSSFHTHHPSPSASDYPASGVLPEAIIAMINQQVDMKMATLKMEMETHIREVIQSHLHQYHDQREEVVIDLEKVVDVALRVTTSHSVDVHEAGGQTPTVLHQNSHPDQHHDQKEGVDVDLPEPTSKSVDVQETVDVNVDFPTIPSPSKRKSSNLKPATPTKSKKRTSKTMDVNVDFPTIPSPSKRKRSNLKPASMTPTKSKEITSKKVRFSPSCKKE